MSRAETSPRRRLHPTRVAWIAVALIVLTVIGLAIGVRALWIPAAVLFAFLLLGLGVPLNVRRLKTPPWLPNSPVDPTVKDRDRRF
jgi:hypothetical protein